MSTAIPYSTTGIYLITNTITGAVYVGSAAKSIRERWENHRVQLRAGTHKNQYLLRAWNKYGEQAFTFTIAEVVKDRSIILEREQCWINEYFPLGEKYCYNLSPTAGSNIGVKNSAETIEQRAAKLRGQKRSDEARQRMSAAQKARPPASAETRRKLSEALKGRTMARSGRNKTYDGFIAPDGTEYRNILNLHQFSKTHGLDSSTMVKLDKGKLKSAKGWQRVESEGRTQFAFISPDGTHHNNITNLSMFSKEHGLTFQAMSRVFYGTRPHHKGWTKG